MPSVTTVLNVIAKPALLTWAAKQGAKAVLMDPVKYDTPYAEEVVRVEAVFER